MIKPKTFRKLPECDTCLFYTSNLMMPCQIHPRGTKEDSCLDYRDDPKVEQHWRQFLGLDSGGDRVENYEDREI